MSRSAKIRGVFGDGIKDFALTIGGLEELQEACDAGPEEIFFRIKTGKWRVADVRETLRIALIGGGLPATRALVLVDRHASTGGLAEWKVLAAAIIAAALDGAPDEDTPAGESKGEPNLSPDEKSGSQPSTSPAPGSA